MTVNDGRVPTSAQAQGLHTYAISFTPRDAQNHTVELRFNSQDVPGSPFSTKVREIKKKLNFLALHTTGVHRQKIMEYYMSVFF